MERIMGGLISSIPMALDLPGEGGGSEYESLPPSRPFLGRRAGPYIGIFIRYSFLWRKQKADTRGLTRACRLG